MNLNTHSAYRGSAVDQGLALFMRRTFNYMTGGVAISALVAFVTMHSPALLGAAMTPATQILFMLVWFGLGFFFQKLAFSLSPAGAIGAFALFSAVTGFALSPLVMVYTGADITLAFIAAAAVFAGASIYGYTTKRPLYGLGSFLAVGGIGLMIFAFILIGMAMFGHYSGGLSIVFSLLVIPFVTLATAFQVNMLAQFYGNIAAMGEASEVRMSTVAALNLYTNFVVLFLNILQLLGAVNRR